MKERELLARTRDAARDDLATRGGVPGEHAVVTKQVPARRWHDRAQAREQVERVEQDGVGAVLPGRFEAVEDAPSIWVTLEALLCERRARDVADEALEAHGWPGNVRELDHTLERAVLMAQGGAVRAADLGLRPVPGASPRLEDLPLEEVERLLIRKALERHGGNVSHAAKALGGRVGLSEVYKEGTTAWVELPVGFQEPAAQAAAPGTPSGTPREGTRGSAGAA